MNEGHRERRSFIPIGTVSGHRRHHPGGAWTRLHGRFEILFPGPRPPSRRHFFQGQELSILFPDCDLPGVEHRRNDDHVGGFASDSEIGRP